MTNMVLTGDLSYFSLGDVIQLIGSLGSSGILQLKSDFVSEPAQVYFIEGNIVNASTHSEDGLYAIYSLFGWTDARFEFFQEDVTISRVINENRMAIIMDGLRMVDDGSIDIVGPASDEDETNELERIEVPVIKGPPADYIYVATEEGYSKDQQIAQENTYSDWIWVILEGMVEITKKTSRGAVNVLRLGEGSFIGSLESFLFQNSIRNMTTTAITDVQLGVLDIQRLAQEFSVNSLEFKKILISLDKRLRQLSEHAAKIYSNEVHIKYLIKNKKLTVKQGQKKKKSFVMISKGEAVIARYLKPGWVPLAYLGPGDFIGSLPFPDLDIGHEPTFASVFASRDIQVTLPDSKLLIKEYERLSPMLKTIIRNMADSITAINNTAQEIHQLVNVSKT